MPEAKTGDTVKVHYTGRFDDGDVFDTTTNREPFQFTIGEDDVILGFQQAVIGMKPGDTKTERITPKSAYGPYRSELVVEVDKTTIADDVEPEIGQRFRVSQPDGQKFDVTVKEVSDSKVTFDANHPLAGQDLTFDIELIEIIG